MIFGEKCSKARINKYECKKLKSIAFDRKLSFRKHVEDLGKKTNQKLHSLTRLSTYIDSIKLEILMNSYIMSQFNYCLLAWMFNDRVLNSKLSLIHERAFILVCKQSIKS